MGERGIYKHLFLMVFMVVAFTAHPIFAWAQTKIRALNEGNVRAFIEKTTDVTRSNTDNLSSENINEYLDQHIEKKARFKSLIRYHLPAMPVQQTQLSLSKAEFMESINKGAESVDGYENLVEISDIKIDTSGKKAFVKTKTTEYGELPVPTEAGVTEDVPIEGTSECRQILSLNDGIIQMFSANCTTDIIFLEF